MLVAGGVMVVAGGVTMVAGGVTVVAGGVTVVAGGVTVVPGASGGETMVAGDSGGGVIDSSERDSDWLGTILNYVCLISLTLLSMHGLFICYLTYCLKPLFSLASSQGKVALEIDSSS